MYVYLMKAGFLIFIVSGSTAAANDTLFCYWLLGNLSVSKTNKEIIFFRLTNKYSKDEPVALLSL